MWHKFYFDEDTEKKLGSIFASGSYEIDERSGLAVPATRGGYVSNWLFTGVTDSRRDCFFYHSTLFSHFQFVPSTCRFRCWKVVVGLNTFAEAFRWWGVMQAMPFFYGLVCPLHGKVGMDVRYYTSKPWASFFYNSSQEEGREVHKLVQQAVNDHMPNPENIPVVLKRSCTEFERAKGQTDTDFWKQMTPEEVAFEERMRDIFAPVRCYTVQPDWMKNKTIWRWTKWAMAIGDRTPIEVFGHDEWLMKPVTYHEPDTLPSKGGEFNPNAGDTGETFQP